MTRYQVRPGAQSYGHDIGILLIECSTPFIPGDVGNAYSYRFPVLYETIKELDLEQLIERGNTSLAPHVIEAALRLQAQGVRAISSDCGYMLHFQEQVAAALNIPVMLSSLLQLPFISSTLGPHQAIGVICANRRRLTPELLAKAYPPGGREVFIRGMEEHQAFCGPILDETGELDDEAIRAEIVGTARQLVQDHPQIGAILLECSNMPPYAHAVQAATGRPVFDFLTMINQMRAACVRHPYTGGY